MEVGTKRENTKILEPPKTIVWWVAWGVFSWGKHTLGCVCVFGGGLRGGVPIIVKGVWDNSTPTKKKTKSQTRINKTCLFWVFL